MSAPPAGAQLRTGGSLLPSLLGLGFALLYGASQTRGHTFDALLYARAIRDGSWTDALHPQHLLYGVMIRGFWKFLLQLGLHVDPLGAAAMLNSAAAGAAVAVFASWLLEAGVALPWALLGSAGLGFSQCHWMFASENESYAGAILLMLLAVRAAGRAQRSGRSVPGIAAALWVALAATLHAAALLLLLPLSLFALDSKESARERARAALRGILTATVPVVIAYALALAWRGELSPGAGAAWMNRYMRWDSWRPGNPLRILEGALWMVRAVAPDFGLIGGAPHPFSGAAANFLARGPFLLAGAAIPFLVWFAWARGRKAEPAAAGMLRLCMLWLGCYGVLLGWIGRSSLKFWSLTLPPLWALGVMLLAGSLPAPGAAGRRFRLAALGAYVGLLFLLNGFVVIARRADPGRDLAHISADSVLRIARPGDFVLAPSGDLEACLRYYGAGLDVATLESLARKTRSMDATLAALESSAARAQAAGGHAWCLGTGLVVTRDVSELWNQAPDGMAARRAWRGSLELRAAYGDTTSTTGPEGVVGQSVMLEWKLTAP